MFLLIIFQKLKYETYIKIMNREISKWGGGWWDERKKEREIEVNCSNVLRMIRRSD